MLYVDVTLCMPLLHVYLIRLCPPPRPKTYMRTYQLKVHQKQAEETATNEAAVFDI